jgi:hypothetical protein
MIARPWYAAGARKLLENRQHGMAPSGPVVVSLIGGSFGDVAAVTLHVHADMPAERLDWRMLVNLEVWLWADASIPLERVVLLADRIARARPKRLCLRFDHRFAFANGDGGTETIDTHDLDIGDGFHHDAIEEVPAIHAFLWSPVPVNGTPIERQLRNALRGTHQLGTWL